MRRLIRPGVACAASLVIYACSLAPRHTRPEAPIAPTYPVAYAGDTAAGTAAHQLAWEDFFADPRLAVLVRRALENNRDLRIAVSQVEEARARYRIQRAEQLPTLGVSGDASRNRVGPTALSSSGSNASLSEALRYERYFAGAAVSSFELDFWGRVRNLSAAARAEYLATVEAARSFRLSLIREVANAYLTALEVRERLDLAEATVQSRRDGLRIAKRRLDAGVTSALDYSQAETLLTQAEIELAALKLSLAQSENLLTTLVGAPLTDDLPPPVPLSEQGRLETLAAGLPSELLTARPDIIAAEARLRAARANIGAARAAFLPSITLTGSYGYASSELDDLFGENSLTWSYGPTITLPLFDFGRRRANLDIAKAREIQAIADYERTIQDSFREVADALAGRKFLAEQVDAQQRATFAQRRLAELARTRYREGVVGYLEVLDAERNLFAAEQALLQVRRAEVTNLVTLYVALGGGLGNGP
jgi:multidrug efflux system outer membrane protein